MRRGEKKVSKREKGDRERNNEERETEKGKERKRKKQLEISGRKEKRSIDRHIDRYQ
jgi:hypothetical protein